MKKNVLGIIFLLMILCTGCNNFLKAITSEPTTTPTKIPATPTPTPTDVPKEATPIFYLTLVDTDMELNGQYVEVIVPINTTYGKNHIRATDELEYCLNVYLNRDLTEKEKSSKFAKVQGTVSSKSSGNYWEMHNIKDCTLIEVYDKAPKSYKKQLNAYLDEREKKLAEKKEADQQALAEAREEFIKYAKDDISYKDLCRYPDTYKGTKLKLKVKVTEVEADSWLSNGAIYAEYQGEEIIIHDEREIREPRLIKGDNIVIYVTGDGLAKIQQYVKGSGLLGTSIGADVVDEYEVPAVQLMYTEDLD